MNNRLFSTIALLLCLMMLLPVTAYAAVFDVGETDLYIEIDDTSWYVFTRNNIKDNPELEEVGIAYENIYDVMHQSDIYLDAFVVDYDTSDILELVLIKDSIGDGENFSEYSDDEFLEITEEFAEIRAEDYELIDYQAYITEYKFIKIEYYDQDYGGYIMEYSTVMNGDMYLLKFMSVPAFGDWDYAEMDKIVDSILFDVEPSASSDTDTEKIGKSVGRTIAVVLAALIAKKKNKGTQENGNDCEKTLYCKKCGNSMSAKADCCDRCGQKRRRFTMKTAAIILFVLQGIAIFGSIVSGSMSAMISDLTGSVYGVFELLGFFLPSIIGIIFLVSYHQRNRKKAPIQDVQENLPPQ